MMYRIHGARSLVLGAVALGRQRGEYCYIHFVLEEMETERPCLKSYKE